VDFLNKAFQQKFAPISSDEVPQDEALLDKFRSHQSHMAKTMNDFTIDGRRPRLERRSLGLVAVDI